MNDLDLATLFDGIEGKYLYLLMFTFSVAIYAILIYLFYKFVSRRDVFGFDISQYKKKKSKEIFPKIFNFVLSILKYGLIFPVIVFIWFAGFSVMLFVFSKSLNIDQILILSITVVSAIRILSYVKEELAADVAKLLPLTLLGVFLSNPDFFSFYLLDQRIYLLGAFVKDIIHFLLFCILLEWILRVIFFLRVQTLGLPEEEVDLEKEKKMEVEIEEKIIDRLTKPKD
ncbi:MAG: hypothetical protein WC501_03250 [Candidatus Micrarchaeia archaeon]|jgi:hypothetical protein